MPLADPSTPPTFSDVYPLLDLTLRQSRRRHDRARGQLVYQQGELRYAVEKAMFDSKRVVATQAALQRAQQEEKEAQLLRVLLEDTTFRRELVTLDMLWRRLRMTHTWATDNRFADVVMSMPEEQTVELRASWKAICDLIASKVTQVPASALTL